MSSNKLGDTKHNERRADLVVQHRWIAGKISDILGAEDDVVIELCFNLIEGSRYVRINHIISMIRYSRLMSGAAGYQEATNPAYWISR